MAINWGCCFHDESCVYSLKKPTSLLVIYIYINWLAMWLYRLRNKSPTRDLAGNGFVSTSDLRWLATRILPRLSWFLCSSFLRHLLPFPSFPSRQVHFPGILNFNLSFFLLLLLLPVRNWMEHHPPYTITIQFGDFNNFFSSFCSIFCFCLYQTRLGSLWM